MKKIFILFLCILFFNTICHGQTWNITATMTAILDKGVLVFKTTREEESMPNRQIWPFERQSVISLIIEKGITTVGDYAFYKCGNLTSITIPATVTYIGEAAFRECGKLTSVEMPNSVSYISDQAFYGCSSLPFINIPESIKRIGAGTFAGCSSLKSATIHNSITSIEESAFASCSSLTLVAIPNSVTKIGQFAFSSCSNLKNIIVNWFFPLSFIGNGMMSSGQASDVTLHVPAGTENLYKNAQHWRDYKIVTYTDNETISATPLSSHSSNGLMRIVGLRTGQLLKIYSVMGELVYKGKAKYEEQSFSVSERGVYVIVMGDQTIKAVAQ